MNALRLGKLPARRDSRTIRLARFFSRLPPIPKSYRFELRYPGLPTPMFANDRYGDCVIAGRAHQTLRLERVETGKTIRITTRDVLTEYWNETGGEDRDTGLVMLDSLKAWRDPGWLVGKRTYTIDAFGSINPRDGADVRAAVFLLNGIQVGLFLPISAKKQMGKVWEVVKGPTGWAGTWGGHCVTISSYDEVGPICVTWGEYQRMTWAFFARYCDENYGVVDSLNKWTKQPGIDVAKLKRYLDEITKG